MKLPFEIIGDIGCDGLEKWNNFYRNPPGEGRNPRTEEGLWRRTQDSRNSAESGYMGPGDQRRRIVHYEHGFDVLDDRTLALTSTYLFLHFCYPAAEIDQHKRSIEEALDAGGWEMMEVSEQEKIFRRGDLEYKVTAKEAGNDFLPQYKILEVTVISRGNEKDAEFQGRPWGVLKTGIRTKDVRGNPEIIENFTPDVMRALFPAQFELGCGASIEAGIPALHFLHDVYKVTDKETGKFIFDPAMDTVARDIARDPESAFSLFTEMYRRCFMAEPTGFHHTLRELHDMGIAVGPVITNNFDGLPERVGLPEKYLRRYEETHIVPDMEFDPRAKSLIVIGSHADRRRVQQAAREQGLKVLYIDPEGYDLGNQFIAYPLESPQDGDFLMLAKAAEAMDNLYRSVIESCEFLNDKIRAPGHVTSVSSPFKPEPF